MCDHEDLFDQLATWPSLTWTDTGRLRSSVSHLTCAQKVWMDTEDLDDGNQEPKLNAAEEASKRTVLDRECWLVYPRPNPQASFRLFCFPYAGGGSITYRAWVDSLPDSIELGLILLPGRETRLSEPAFKQVAPLVQVLARVLQPHLVKEFAFFGHSMGAIITFELARQLRRLQGLSPTHLFVSGRGAPQVPDSSMPTYNLPEPELLIELKRLRGTPCEVLENPELMRLILPALRADFELVQTYSYSSELPLDCPITAFGGQEDEEIASQDLEAWREQTKKAFSLHILPGDHFFINSQRLLLLKKLSEELNQMAKAAS
jgi:medium-chain acyl-[acyl-carrier-protein] hydrolase